MTTAKYLSEVLLEKDLVIMGNIIYVVLPVLSITVLMFSLRSIFQDSYNPKIKKQ